MADEKKKVVVDMLGYELVVKRALDVEGSNPHRNLLGYDGYTVWGTIVEALDGYQNKKEGKLEPDKVAVIEKILKGMLECKLEAKQLHADIEATKIMGVSGITQLMRPGHVTDLYLTLHRLEANFLLVQEYIKAVAPLKSEIEILPYTRAENLTQSLRSLDGLLKGFVRLAANGSATSELVVLSREQVEEISKLLEQLKSLATANSAENQTLFKSIEARLQYESKAEYKAKA